ncbi:Gp49 family protein [Burkholderia gladioli]|uniref:Gp49 family protein n=1 Tax=Burkholderia gladioli TaxID=28095 RepID=UPI00163F413B|nr:Gp49 family protein [Burkholderia gladioli]
MNDNDIEREIIEKGKTAPRVTPAAAEALIIGEHYLNAGECALGDVRDRGPLGEAGREVSPMDLLTFCVLVLRNGFTVTGESACASPENFDAEIGRKIARQNAVAKIWPLEGYLLKQRLHDAA